MYHIPVLLNESIAGLNIHPDGIYVDVTFGSGGHSAAILEKLKTGKLIAFDRDKDAEKNAFADSRLIFIRQNFRYLKNFLNYHGIQAIDGLLGDLGISSHQIDIPERGFSTRFDGKLDMRMDQDLDLDAASILNKRSKEELVKLFRENGEINNAPYLVREIMEYRASRELRTTAEFKNILQNCAPRGKENQYMAKAFQAVRIEVNEELESLKDMITQACDLLKTGGRLVIISYHSLEDRIVKNFIKTGNFEGTVNKDFYGNLVAPLRPVTRKATEPSDAEQESNPRSRSAKLRVAEKI